MLSKLPLLSMQRTKFPKPAPCRFFYACKGCAFAAVAGSFLLISHRITTMDRHLLAEELARDEGLRLKPYRCSAGKLTIGFGRNLEDVGLSEVEARILLDGDIERAIHLCRNQSWFSTLGDTRQRVIVNMAFNLGMPRLLKFQKMIDALKRYDYDRAADEMLDSLWARQVGKRAERLAEMMRGGE